jgi:hypothetical protein
MPVRLIDGHWSCGAVCALLLGSSSLLLAGEAAAPVAATEVVARPAPLVDAARAKDGVTALQLLQANKAAARERAVDGTTALHWAVYNDDATLVERLTSMPATTTAPRRWLRPPWWAMCR